MLPIGNTTADGFMWIWSWVFSPVVGTSIFAISTIIMLLLKRYVAALHIASSAVLTTTVVVVLKSLVGRVRPTVQPDVWATGGSFPSGHAAIAACVWMLTWKLTRNLPTVQRASAIALATLVMLFTGASRLYFQVHYPTDVLAGFAIGLLCTWGAGTQIKIALK